MLHILFIFYIFLAGYGMYRLTLHFSGNSNTSLAIGIAYMLSGFFVGHGQALFAIIGAAFLPWVVFYMIKNLADPSLSGTIKLSLFIFLQISTGYQAITIITGYLLLLLFIWSLFQSYKDRSRFLSIIKFNGLLFLLLVLLCLVIFIPVIEIAHLNARLGSGLLYKKAIAFPFTLKCLLSLVIPFATVKNPAFFGTDLSMSNMHFSLIILITFLATVFKRKTGLQWVILSFGFVCFLASLGNVLPVHPFLYNHLPLFNRLRMPAYFTLFAIFAILISTGIHLPELLKRIDSYRKPLIILFALALGVLILGFINSVFHINFRESILRQAFHQFYLIWNGLTFYENIAIQSLIQGLLVTLLLVTLTNKRFLNSVGIILPVVIVIEMVFAVNLNLHYTVISETSPKELHSFITTQPKGFPLPDHTRIIDNSDKKLMYPPLWRNMGILTKRISYDGFTSFILKPYDYLYDSLPVLKDSLLHNPFAYFARNVHSVSELKSRPASFSKKDLYIPDSVFSALPADLKKNTADNKVNILSFSPNSFKVQYENDSSSVLTLMQADYPGWQVKIDGKEVSHFTSDYLYLSVVVPPGNHQVVYDYKNRVVVISFIISYSVLILLILILCYMHFRSSSRMKARLFTALILAGVLFCGIRFFTNNDERKKIKTYRSLSAAFLKWNHPGKLNSFSKAFNLDDTLLFNRLKENTNINRIKYFRFNDAGDLGSFYRFVLKSPDSDLVYGSANLYNPVETEYMIRESFPVLKSKNSMDGAQIALYSRSGDGEGIKIIYSNKNDYESACKGWSGEPSGYGTSAAFTGNFGEKMDSTRLYSSTFHENINKISKGKEIAIVISADVFLVGNSSPLLVYDEKKGERSIRWNSLDVRKFAGKSGSWEKVFFMLKIKKNISDKNSIVIYFWNPDKSTFYIDNFKVEGYLSVE
jgi:hypothetical protein